MALAQSTRSGLSLSQKVAEVTKSTAGLDLILRLLQALSQIASEAWIDSKHGIQFSIATSQLALGWSLSHQIQSSHQSDD